MVVVAPDRSVRSVDVLAFGEPQDYLPRGGWLKRVEGKRQRGRALRRAGRWRTSPGATLTTRAIAAAVRRVLAVHALLGAPAPPAK